jgi:hypothetical protein
MDQCSNRHDIPAALQGDLTNRPGHDLELGIDTHSRIRQCSPASGSVISIPRALLETVNGTLIKSH